MVQLKPRYAWPIGVVLNLALAIPGIYPATFTTLAAVGVIGSLRGEDALLGAALVWTLYALVSLAVLGLITVMLNRILLSRSPALPRRSYWLMAVALVVVPNVVRLVL